MTQFFKDLEQAKGAEQLVREQLTRLSPEYDFIDVSNEKEYFHKGDIKAVDKDGNEIMIEVKDDSRIADTHNILCEEKNIFFDTGAVKEGNFHSDYEIYSIVSKPERKIYLFDFSILKQIYKHYRKIEIYHPENISIVYLVPVATAERKGALITEISY